jgi:hypothetical protein
VVEDCVREGWTREVLDDRIASKFGATVLDDVLSVVKRRHDDDGVEFARDEIRDDFLARLTTASERARWACAADKVHNAGTTLADLRRTIDVETVWGRLSGGRDGTIGWYRAVAEQLGSIGFRAPIVAELAALVEDIGKV